MVKQIVVTDKALFSFSDFVSVDVERDQTELVNCEAITIQYYQCVCVFLS